MKKLFIISLMTFLITVSIDHVNGQELTSQQRSIIEKQVDVVFHDMVKIAENLDYDKLSKGVDDTYHAGFIINGSYFATYDSLITVIKAKSQGATRQSITIQKEKISVLSESIVLVTALGDSKVEVSSGNSFTTKFYWSFVYKKMGNNWKVIQSHQSVAR